MKRILFFGSLILTVACQGISATPTSESTPTATAQTPLEPATATMTFTPPPTEILPPTPVPLYFTEEFNIDLHAWTFFQTGGETTPSVTLENDRMRVDISSPHTWYLGIHNSNTYKEVSVSTNFNGAPSGSMGLVCKYGEKGWYEFNVASDGTYSVLLGQWLSEGVAQYLPIATDNGQYLQSGNMNYEIKLTCLENKLILYINQKLFRKLDVTNYALREGMVGITAASFDSIPATYLFEWLKVTEE